MTAKDSEDSQEVEAVLPAPIPLVSYLPDKL
jgi:hypothetical protein